ncbi:MAG: DUF6973 domain-containing protein [Flavobacteriales bacterium]|jgi:hypothetical protein|tara:strand:+ start:1522 stop:2697 length:1176 start_codon:yes stop_codon:yes gene_type:complete
MNTKKIYSSLFVMIITTLVLYSCKKEIADPEMFTQSEYETALSFLENANPPKIPYEGCILAMREYEYQNQEITDSAQRFTGMLNYLDTRLNELFPDIVYPGFMDEMQQLYENFKLVRSFEISPDSMYDTYSNPTVLEGYQSFETLYSEMRIAEIDEENPDDIHYTNYLRGLDSLSQRTYSNRVSLQELTDYATTYSQQSSGSGKTLLSPWTSYLTLVNPINWVRGISGLIFHKKIDSLVLKFAEQPDFFGSHINQSPSNAFKHSLTAMLYRNYFGAAAADFAMWKHEYTGGNECRDMHMDLHNNDMGGFYKYYAFRKPLTTLWWKNKKFAERVRDYIQDENNGVLVNGAFLGDDWSARIDTKGSKDCEDCKEDRKKKRYGITKKKYIYLKP